MSTSTQTAKPMWRESTNEPAPAHCEPSLQRLSGQRVGPRALRPAGKLGTGCVHDRLPDGGAGVIAGLDLTENTHVIIGVFAWMKYLTSQQVFFSGRFSSYEAHTAPGSPGLLRPAGP